MNGLINKTVTLKPRIPSENEALCQHCEGVGWISGDGFIERCNHCYGSGTIQLCPECHKPMCGVCMEMDCRKKREQVAEESRFNKSVKYTLDTIPKEHSEMYFSEVYGYDDGYFGDIDDLLDYCQSENIKPPAYVWGTDKTMLSLDAMDVVSDACEELHEGAFDSISSEDIKEVQDFFDKWCKRQAGTATYSVNYSYCILIDDLI